MKMGLLILILLVHTKFLGNAIFYFIIWLFPLYFVLTIVLCFFFTEFLFSLSLHLFLLFITINMLQMSFMFQK